MTARLEHARPDDLELVRLLDAQATEVAERYGGPSDDDHVEVRDNARFVLLRVDDVAVACGAVQWLDATTAEVKRMYVVPEQRGHGLSKVVLAEVERIARDSGATHARLETGTRQPEAIALYEASGYHRIPLYGEYVGDEFSVCFEKPL